MLQSVECVGIDNIVGRGVAGARGGSRFQLRAGLLKLAERAPLPPSAFREVGVSFFVYCDLGEREKVE